MAFSKRTQWHAQTNAISQAMDDLKNRGMAVLDMTQSNPTQAGFHYPESWVQSLSNPQNNIYHPDALGMASARQHVARFTGVDARQVMLTASTSESYSFLFRLLLDPGDKVLIPRPSYPLFQFLLELNDAAYEHYPLVYAHDRWRIDFPALEKCIDAKTKAVVLVNPNNPTGSYLKSDELDALNRICRRHNLSIISDEVFYEYPLEPDLHVSLKGNADVLTFVMGGLSKSVALPHMKVGWILTSGPEKDAQEALQRLEIIADTFLSVNTPAQNALGLWLGQSDVIRQEIIARVKGNLDMLKQSGLSLAHVEAGWYAVIRAAGHDEDDLVLRLLNEHQLLVHPGYFFDFWEEGYLVVSLLPLPEHFAKMVKILKGII